MTANLAGDEAWLAWYDELRKVTELQGRGDLRSAIALIDHYLASNPAPVIKSDALSFRAIALEDLGNLQAAKRDFLSAHALSQPASYARYTIELSLADLCRRLQQAYEAQAWYFKALETVAEDSTTSGGSALWRFLDLVGERSLTDRETAICRRVVRQSWELQQLSGEPELEDLRLAADKIRHAESR
jgi:tetratricopeptide (TPR) repeat protein